MYTDNNNDLLLNQLRADYAVLKERLEKQEIINERLLSSTFSSKVKDIHSIGWTSSICAVFVIAISPVAFHYNPVFNLSWAFTIGTDVMMFACLFFNWYFHHGVKAPQHGDDLLAFAGSVKLLRKRYQMWIRVGFGLIAVWLSWMLIELYFKLDTKEFCLMLIPLVSGVVIGGAIGLRMDRKLIGRCNEIIREIEGE